MNSLCLNRFLLGSRRNRDGAFRWNSEGFSNRPALKMFFNHSYIFPRIRFKDLRWCHPITEPWTPTRLGTVFRTSRWGSSRISELRQRVLHLMKQA